MEKRVPDYVLFLDDERDPPKPSDVFDKTVVHAKNIREFMHAVETRGEPFMVMFDWYLGGSEPDGLDAVAWLIKYDRAHDILTPDLMFDSQSSDKKKAREIVSKLSGYLAEKFGVPDADDLAWAARRNVPKGVRPSVRRHPPFGWPR